MKNIFKTNRASATARSIVAVAAMFAAGVPACRTACGNDAGAAGGMGPALTEPAQSSGFAKLATPAWVTVQPSSLAQTVEKGANPVSMSFNVWNSGPQPRANMDYTVAGDAWWILPLGSGKTFGDNINTVAVQFADMTTVSTGVYQGVITVVGQDEGLAYPPSTQQINVAISILDLPAPDWLTASAGEYDNQVVLNWAPVTPFPGGSLSYEIWRGSTRDFNEQFVMRIVGGLETTTFSDSSALPGEIYYYWARAVNGYGGAGVLSAYDIGYRALGAPEGIWASEGTYYNKVHLRWAGVDGAQVYEVWRADPYWKLVQTTAALEYNDFTVVEGVRYQYKTRGLKNGSVIQPGAYSRAVAGFVLSRPSGLTATQGMLVGKVRLSWTAGWGAAEYEVWRLRGAVYERIGVTAALTYDDGNVAPGTQYTYIVKGRNSSGATEFSAAATGYAGASGVDVKIWQPILLPRNLLPGTAPRVLSMRVANLGGAPLAGDNGKVSAKYYAYRYATDTTTYLGSFTTNLNLAPGQSLVLCVPGSALRMPAAPDEYSIWTQVMPAWPSQLSDTNILNNTATVRGSVKVDALAMPGYWGFNDYDGDGLSDLALDVDGAWYVRTVDGRQLGWSVPFGGNLPPVYGLDMDGDNRGEPMVFRDGEWRAMLSASGYAAGSLVADAPGCRAAPGDFTGNGRGNLAAYFPADGRWFILDDALAPLLWGEVFGGEGMVVVPGDYDGDGVWDLTVYQEATGLWYSRRLDGGLLMWELAWGGPGYKPVMGDFNGDGVFDLAVYRETTATWHIQTVQGEEIIRNYRWGGQGFAPVPGDYDGDGYWDLAIYGRGTGAWQVRSLLRGTILASTLWGAPGYLPVGVE